jgi:alpha-L-fucosidase
MEMIAGMEKEKEWFDNARFGLFIHWGAYSVAGRGEWAMNRECIPLEEYRKNYASRFKAENYDPDAWAKLALDAGMKYVVLTTKHHDGFCLWDTNTTDYNTAKIGPERDLLVPYVEAMRRHGLKVGFYYSVADWANPDYPGAYERDWPTEWHDVPARERFIAFYQAQLEELMTRYGKIDILWYDGCYPKPLDGNIINEKIKKLQPGIMINERNGEPSDFKVSEKSLKEKPGRWESCFNVNNSWGWRNGADEWKTPMHIVRMLLEVSSQGGNFLLNLGPKPSGEMPDEGCKILRTVGKWLRRNGEFLTASARSPFTWNSCSIVTVKDNYIYLHLKSDPGEEYCFCDIANPVKSVIQLDNRRELKFGQEGRRLFITGYDRPELENIVSIRLEVEGQPETVSHQKSFWIVD